MKKNNQHITTDNLFALYRGELDLEQINRYMSHIDECDECSTTFEAMKAFEDVELRQPSIEYAEKQLDEKLLNITKQHIEASQRNNYAQKLKCHFYDNGWRYLVAVAASLLLIFLFEFLVPEEYSPMAWKHTKPSINIHTITYKSVTIYDDNGNFSMIVKKVSNNNDLLSDTIPIYTSDLCVPLEGAYDIIDHTTHNIISLKNMDMAATEVHWATEKTYEYFLNTHDRNSIDSMGAPLLSWVHYGNQNNNVYWNGAWMLYGDGDGIKYSSLTSMDIVAHEIMHGLTDYTSNLIYEGESGALNQSFSDIFGEVTERYICEINDWIINADLLLKSGNIGLRSMAAPSGGSNSDDTINPLYWGLVEGFTGYPRRKVTTPWIPQDGYEWDAFIRNINCKHIDADGNGIIDEDDLAVLKENYGKSYEDSSYSYSASPALYTLQQVAVDTVGRMKQTAYNLYLQANAPINTHGISGSVEFKDNPTVSEISIDNSGSTLHSVYCIEDYDSDNHTITLALTRTDKSNQLIDGRIAKLVVMDKDLQGGVKSKSKYSGIVNPVITNDECVVFFDAHCSVNTVSYKWDFDDSEVVQLLIDTLGTGTDSKVVVVAVEGGFNRLWGNIYFSSSLIQNSDKRLKSNIEGKYSLEKIMQLKPTSYAVKDYAQEDDNLQSLALNESNKMHIDNSNTSVPLISGDYSYRCLNVNGQLRPCTQLDKEIKGTRLSDSLNLVKFYESTNGENWINKWNLTQPMDEWEGIGFDNTGRVSVLSLNNNNLTGKIPIELGFLDELIILTAVGNGMTDIDGSHYWPAHYRRTASKEDGDSIAYFPNLEKLDLSYNQLRTIPDFSNSPKLTYLDLSYNQLSFDIPKKIHEMGLRYFNYIGNRPKPFGED